MSRFIWLFKCFARLRKSYIIQLNFGCLLRSLHLGLLEHSVYLHASRIIYSHATTLFTFHPRLFARSNDLFEHDWLCHLNVSLLLRQDKLRSDTVQNFYLFNIEKKSRNSPNWYRVLTLETSWICFIPNNDFNRENSKNSKKILVTKCTNLPKSWGLKSPP